MDTQRKEEDRKEGWKEGDGYTPEYYEHYKEGSFKSAMAILPIVLKRIQAMSCIDAGCGTGMWLKAFKDIVAEKGYRRQRNNEGIKVCGFDPHSPNAIKEDLAAPHSLYTSFGSFDLALCLEVAEHISEEKAERIVYQLCELAPAVLFSAAIPGQGGENHINEQWPDYWAEKFKKQGFIGVDCIRHRVWDDESVEAWYAQNTILYVHPERASKVMTQLLREELKTVERSPLQMIHPRTWCGLHRYAAHRIEVAEKKAAAKQSPSAGTSQSQPAASSEPPTPETPLDLSGVHIYLGTPNSGSNEPLMPNTIVKAANARVTSSLETQMSSALTHNFNQLWCNALNARESQGVTHFAMLHSDIRCLQPEWLDRMIELLIREKCDLLSVIIPIKDGRGLTSTAMDTDPWRPRRFTMDEVYQLPATFGNDDVLKSPTLCEYPVGPIIFNTGLWICRIDQPWAEEVCFGIRNRITRNAKGEFYADFAPEDWEFGRWCHRRGVNYKVTREIEALHVGLSVFTNTAPWGSQSIDEGNIRHLNREIPQRSEVADRSRPAVA